MKFLNYPVNDEKNSLVYAEYKKIVETEKNVIFSRLLSEYKYYDMNAVIASGLRKVREELK